MEICQFVANYLHKNNKQKPRKTYPILRDGSLSMESCLEVSLNGRNSGDVCGCVIVRRKMRLAY